MAKEKKFQLLRENKLLMQATQNMTHDTRPDCWDHVAWYDTREKAIAALKQATDARHQIRDAEGNTLLYSGDVM
jgi:hypothetical protein